MINMWSAGEDVPEERMAGIDTDTIRAWIETGQEHNFYNSRTWEKCRRKVIALDRHECTRCAARGRYSRAELVHHVKHLRDRPDLALQIWDPDTGERQLVSVCKRCHDELHPEAMRQTMPAAMPVTAERWD